MHNGTIDVANVSDIGSVFTIRLPLQDYYWRTE